MKIHERKEVAFDVDGIRSPVRVERTIRQGVNGFLIKQAHSRVFISDEGLDDLITAVEIIDTAEATEPQLGKIERFPRPAVTTPAKWQP